MTNNSDYTQLNTLLREHFSISELKDLCLDLSIDSESFSIARKPDFTRELVEHCRRHDQMCNLVKQFCLVRSTLKNTLKPFIQTFCQETSCSEHPQSLSTNIKPQKDLKTIALWFLVVILLIVISISIIFIRNNTPTWPLEPNDTPSTAAFILPDTEYFEDIDDENDWYQVRLSEKTNVHAVVQNFQTTGQLVFYAIDDQNNRTVLANDGRDRVEMSVATGDEADALTCLDPGVYLLRVIATKVPKPTQTYKLQLFFSPCQDG